MGVGSALCRVGVGETAEPRTELGPLTPTEGLSQLHQAAAAAEQHPPVHLWDLRLQPSLRLHREYRNRVPCRSPRAVRALQGGPWRWHTCCWLTASSCCRMCSTSAWSGTRRGRWCWRTGRDAAPLTLSTAPQLSWSVRHDTLGPPPFLPALPQDPCPPCATLEPSPSLQCPGTFALVPVPAPPCVCPAKPSQGRAITAPAGRRAVLAARGRSQQERVFGRRRALRRDRQQLPGQ